MTSESLRRYAKQLRDAEAASKKFIDAEPYDEYAYARAYGTLLPDVLTVASMLEWGWDLPPGCSQRDCDGPAGTRCECIVCGDDADPDGWRDEDGEPLCSYHRDWTYDRLGFGYHSESLVMHCLCGRAIDEEHCFDDGPHDVAECDLCGEKYEIARKESK